MTGCVEEQFGQAIAFHQQGRLAEAARLYEAVIAADPGHVPALNFLGVLAGQIGDPLRSVELISQAAALDPGQPGIHSNLGLALIQAGRGAEAVERCNRAIALDAQCLEAHSNKGTALWGLGRHDEALESYARALTIQPDHAQTHWNEGFLRMQLGQFEAGWKKQEWRWKLEYTRGDRRGFTQPLWQGQADPRGTTILLHAEQGFGDTIQFCRYAKLVAARGATVILEVQKPLKELLRSIEGVSLLLARGEQLPHFDYHCPLLSLPLAFNTTLDTIPAERAYLRCDPAVVAQWRERLGPKTRPRVGIVWKASVPDRSILLADLLGLVDGDKEFFSLQNEMPAVDQALLDSRHDIVQMTAGLRNFTDAPLVDLMDAIVTADTSMAHLAGALGKRVWLLLPFNPEWRWMLDREDSPWYPTMRLFRQPAAGDWESVIERVRAEIGKLR